MAIASEPHWMGRFNFSERLANVTATIETILASKPFDIARFAVAQGTLADLVVI